MIFKNISIFDSEGFILTSSLTLKSFEKKIKVSKGTLINEEIINLLQKNGFKNVYCAKLEKNEFNENEAALKISEKIILNKKVFYLKQLMTGRVNIISNVDGLFFYNEKQLIEVNNISNSIGIGALKPFAKVRKNQTLATTKIITYGIEGNILHKLSKVGKQLFKLVPFKNFNINIIQTFNNSSKKSILDKTKKVTEERLVDCGKHAITEFRSPHDHENLDKILKNSLKNNPDLILIFGTSAIADEDDLIPSVIKDNGGKILRFGMPVEPGNLVLISSIKNYIKNNKTIYIIGMPGCSKSPKENGVDWIIWRILAGLKITNQGINKMSVGGLIK